MMNEEVLNIREVSIYLKIPVSTLYKLIQEGKVPAVKLGKHWRFMKKDLEMLFEQKGPPSPLPPGEKQG
jgi:excisionase family DNA binding protein